MPQHILERMEQREPGEPIAPLVDEFVEAHPDLQVHDVGEGHRMEARRPDGSVDEELLALLGARNNLGRAINAHLEGTPERAVLEQAYLQLAEDIERSAAQPPLH